MISEEFQTNLFGPLEMAQRIRCRAAV